MADIKEPMREITVTPKELPIPEPVTLPETTPVHEPVPA